MIDAISRDIQGASAYGIHRRPLQDKGDVASDKTGFTPCITGGDERGTWHWHWRTGTRGVKDKRGA